MRLRACFARRVHPIAAAALMPGSRRYRSLHMPIFRIRFSRLLLAAGLCFAARAWSQASTPGLDFSGIWQLDAKTSDSAAVITQRLHAEQRREQAPSSRPAGASSSGAAASPSHTGFDGRGGRGMGGGHGMGGGRRGHQDTQDASSGGNSAPPRDPTPPLFASDAFLNVQQSPSVLRVDFNNTDRLDVHFDGIERASLNGNARVQTRFIPAGLQISLAFGDGTTLDEIWARSPDGHHLTVTETWATNTVKEPIVFTRRYDRLDR